MSVNYLSTIQIISTLQTISTQTNLIIISSLNQLNINNSLLTTSTINGLIIQSSIYQINTRSTINYLNSNLNSTIYTLQNEINNNISTINYYTDPKNYNSNVINNNIYTSTQNDVWIRFINIASTNAVNAISSTKSTLNAISTTYSISLNYSNIGCNYRIFGYANGGASIDGYYFIYNYNIQNPSNITKPFWQELNPYFNSYNLSTTLSNISANIFGLNQEIFPYDVDLDNLSTSQYYSSIIIRQVNLSTISVYQYLSTVSSLVYNTNIVSFSNISTINYINTSSLIVTSNIISTITYISSYISTFNYIDTSTILSLSNLSTIAYINLSTISGFSTINGYRTISTIDGYRNLSTIAGYSTLIGLQSIVDAGNIALLYDPIVIYGLPSSLIFAFQRVSTLYAVNFKFLSTTSTNYLPLIQRGIVDNDKLISSFTLINRLNSITYPIYASTFDYTNAYSAPYKDLYDLYYTMFLGANVYYNFTLSVVTNIIPTFIRTSTLSAVSTTTGFSTLYGYSTIKSTALISVYSSITGFSTLNALTILSSFTYINTFISTFIRSDINNLNTTFSNMQSTLVRL